MKKVLTYIYAFAAIFILPIIIGMGVADSLLKMYELYSRHWVAGTIVCIFTGAVASWFPMLFLIEDIWFIEKVNVLVGAIIGWVGGVAIPLIFGFRSLGSTLSVLLILTTLITVASVLKAIHDNARQLEKIREEKRGL